ncbi:EamA family transporter [Pseudomonas aeruginosa]|uniref:DMT family transporter n=1 Tax=Pseudomonas aeruginosa TaxID=287 RepID=UPI0021F22F34|nr:EamA family transporter [Pseudomonas aeruginosa]MCV4250335.1 EamA family transporter [Pseudomonas aeruginosa]
MHRSLHTDAPLGAALLLALQLAPGSAATAEEQAPVDPPTVQLQRIEVTGSAIRRVDAETAVPISVLRAEELRQQGVTSTEELIGRLSGNQGVYNSSRSVGSATGGASFADLRGIGANKTLVLLNGRRLANNAIDAVSFTALRLFSGALMLAVLLHLRRRPATPARGGWRGAAALFVYAAAFSYAYVQLDAGTGALLLFGAVQVTLLLAGLLRGERLGGQALLGFLLALGGLLFLLLPGASAPPLGGALLMLLSGLAWGLYTLLGRGGGDPLAVSAGNFLRALAFAALLLLAFHGQLRLDGAGLAYALLSGALASGLGYAVWYGALPGLTAIQGASVQLSVPVLAALCGALLLGEPLAPRLPPATLAVLGGIALILAPRLGRAAREGA